MGIMQQIQVHFSMPVVTIVYVRLKILISVHGLPRVRIVAFSTILSLYNCDASMTQAKRGG